MASDIGRLSLMITADAGPMLQALDAAERKGQEFGAALARGVKFDGSRVIEDVKLVGRGLASALSGIAGSDVAKDLGGQLKEAITGAVANIPGGALAAGLSAKIGSGLSSALSSLPGADMAKGLASSLGGGALGALSGIVARIPGGGAIASMLGETGEGMSALAGPAGVAAAALAAVWEKLQGVISAGMKAAKEQLGLARSFDISNAAAASFQQAARLAGQDVSESRAGLLHMERTLQAAAGGSTEAGLAFRRLGLDAHQLAQMPLDQSLQQINASLQSLDGATRNIATRQIFGRHGEEAAALARQLERGAALAQEFDLVLSQTDGSAIRSADLAVKGAGASLEALKQSFVQNIALAAAPALEAVSNLFSQALTFAQPLVSVVKGIVGFVAGIIAGVAGFFKPVLAGLKPVLDLLKGIGGFISDIVTTIGGLIGGVLSDLGEGIALILKPLSWLKDLFTTLFSSSARFSQTAQGGLQITEIADARERRAEVAARQQEIERLRGASLEEIGRIRRQSTNAFGFGGVGTGSARAESEAQRRAIIEQLETELRRQTAEADRARDSALGTAANQANRQLEEQTRTLRVQLATINMTADAAARYAAIREFMARTGASEAEAGQRIGEQLRQQAVARQQLNAAQRERQINEENIRAGDATRDELDLIGRRIGFLQQQRGIMVDMSREEQAILRLRERGASNEILFAAQVRLDALRFAREQEQVVRQGRQLEQQQRTPAEVFADRAAELDQLLDRGGIDFATHAQALAAAAEQAAGPQQEAHGPAALSEGSVAAVQAINRFNRPIETVQDRLLRMAEQAAEQRRLQIISGQNIERELRAGGTLARLRLGR